MAAEVLGREGVTITPGKNMEAESITKTGAFAEACAPDDFVTDRENKVASTVTIRRAFAAPSLN